ncbi:MAG: undecaprenyldiphospho-muramoylpentapeptide beta-N-acetylglucosaminyltransferase [Proteobacteria bacterium]|nr:undecaprenyldiphospho-muramoylpentapeptide beta-N-acetylglucosaminyltransferase [Pseudomonadota bacterium]
MVAVHTTILIMAAGTGGHIFPALSIAQSLKKQGVKTEWLGTRQGMEKKLLADTNIELHPISVKGLRGKGIARLIMAPIMVAVAVFQSMQVIRQVKPDCVLGMGGFVSGPGGIAAKLMGRHLLIHEQNAVAGFTNRLLARFADRVFEAFPNTFASSPKVVHTGNPVRKEIIALNKINTTTITADRPLQLLILGGSQGAAAINQTIPQVLANWIEENRPHVLHQTGNETLDQTRQLYQSLGVTLSKNCRVEAFIEDMSAAYSWADLVVCRSGASTVSELAVVGLPSVLVPYPYHADNQQTVNAQWLAEAGAASLLQQSDLTTESLSKILSDLDTNRDRLIEMSKSAKSLAICNASELIAAQCLEVARV